MPAEARFFLSCFRVVNDQAAPLAADRQYKVAGWAPVAEDASGEPIWELMTRYLQSQKVVAAPQLNTPTIKGLQCNVGWAD